MTTLWERRRRVEEVLAKALPSDFVLVNGPDHPLLLRAPDLLAGGQGSLTAFFLPSARERRDPKMLLGHVILNRLALPPTARCVLLVHDPEDKDVAVVVGDAFAHVMDYRAAGNLLRAHEAEDAPGARTQPVPDNTRWVALQAYGQLLRATRLLESGTSDILPGSRLRRHLHPRSSQYDTIQDTLRYSSEMPFRRMVRFGDFPRLPGDVPIVLLRQGQCDGSHLSDLAQAQARHAYRLDSGILYPRRPPPAFAVVEARPRTVSRDLGKPARAAAFGGWCIVPAGQEDLVPRMAEIVSRSLGDEP